MIRISHLSKRYRGAESPTLSDVSLELPDKGMLFLYGPSGSGKTTLLNCVGGLLEHGGQVDYGPDFPKKADDVRSERVGYVFQNFLLEGEKSVYENVASPLRMLSLTDEEIESRAMAALAQVGLALQCRRKAEDLSTGQKQRVSLARAIAKSPALLIADEPTGNLDSASGEEVMGILKSLSASALVLVVSHDIGLVREYADAAYEVAGGTIRRKNPASLAQGKEAGGGRERRADLDGLSVLVSGKPPAGALLRVDFRGGKAYLTMEGASLNGPVPDEESRPSPKPLPALGRLPERRDGKGHPGIAFETPLRKRSRKERGGIAASSALAVLSSLLFALASAAYFSAPLPPSGYYAKEGTLYLESPTVERISSAELLKAFSDPDSGLSETATIGLSSGIHPSLDYRDFSSCHAPAGENASAEEAIPFYFADYGSYEGSWLTEGLAAPGAGGCYVDRSLLGHLKGCYEDEESLAKGSFSLRENTPFGARIAFSAGIKGYLDTGLPFVMVDSGARELNYRFRHGGSFSYGASLGAIRFLDYDALPAGLSLEKYDPSSSDDEALTDAGGPLCYVSDAAGAYLARGDFSSLALSISTSYRLVDAADPQAILVALRDYAGTTPEGTEVRIPSKERLASALASKIAKDGYLDAYAGERMTEGKAPESPGEVSLPAAWKSLFGAEALESAWKNSGFAVSGYHATLEGPLCSGAGYYLASLMPASDPMTRFRDERYVYEGAPRLFALDENRARSYLGKLSSGAYSAGDLLQDYALYQRRLAFKKSSAYFYAAGASLALSLLFSALLAFGEVNRERYEIGLYRCLGMRRGRILAGKAASRLAFGALYSLAPSIPVFLVFLALSTPLAPWWLTLLYLASLVLAPELAYLLPLSALLAKEPALIVKNFE